MRVCDRHGRVKKLLKNKFLCNFWSLPQLMSCHVLFFKYARVINVCACSKCVAAATQPVRMLLSNAQRVFITNILFFFSLLSLSFSLFILSIRLLIIIRFICFISLVSLCVSLTLLRVRVLRISVAHFENIAFIDYYYYYYIEREKKKTVLFVNF